MNSNASAAAEKDLVARAQTDRQAFLEIYDTHFKRIYNYAYYRTLSQADAEEVTSQTFLTALENIQRFEYRNVPLAVWLYKIAANAITDLYRKRSRTLPLNEEYPACEASTQPEAAALGKSETEQLIRHLRSLPPLQQQALILRYTETLSAKEIGAILDKTEGAVKQLLHRGLTTLRERMVIYE